MTDVWLQVDRMFLFRLLKPDHDKAETKCSLAGIEAMKMKKLCGALRALWRSSQENGFDNRVTELKSYVRPSPSRQAPSERDSEPDPPLDETGNDSGVPSDAEREDPNPADNDDESGDEHDGDDDEHGDDGGAASAAGDDDGHASSEGEGDQDDGESEDAEKDEAADQPSQDSLAATTWVLGQEPTREVHSSDSEDLPDSQAPGAGWLGRAYNTYNSIDKDETQKEREVLAATVLDIKKDLEAQLETEIEDADAWDAYKVFCRNGLMIYGHAIYARLASVQSFTNWLEQNHKARIK